MLQGCCCSTIAWSAPPPPPLLLFFALSLPLIRGPQVKVKSEFRKNRNKPAAPAAAAKYRRTLPFLSSLLLLFLYTHFTHAKNI